MNRERATTSNVNGTALHWRNSLKIKVVCAQLHLDPDFRNAAFAPWLTGRSLLPNHSRYVHTLSSRATTSRNHHWPICRRRSTICLARSKRRTVRRPFSMLAGSFACERRIRFQNLQRQRRAAASNVVDREDWNRSDYQSPDRCLAGLSFDLNILLTKFF